MPIEICEELAERLAKREEEFAERAAEYVIAPCDMGDVRSSPNYFLRYELSQS